MLRSTLVTTRILARRVGVAVMGATVVAIGMAMLILPGPATLVIPAGLAILALEFDWARRWLKRAQCSASSARRDLHRRWQAAANGYPSAEPPGSPEAASSRASSDLSTDS